MNVRLEAASARVFMRILRDTLGAAAEASHLLLPRGDASALFPDAAERALRAAGAEIRLRDAALALARIDPARWRVILRSNSLDVDRVILALPPARSAALLSSTGHADVRTATEQLTRIESAPIATVYLRYAPTTRLDRPLFALREQPSTGDYGQWVFDRGLLEESNAGVLSVVVSGAGPHTELTQEELAQAVARQLSRSFALPPPLAHAVLTEKRATIAPGPGLVRPPVRLPLPFLYLASDAAENPYPSTLEGAVRAGRAAARAAIEDTALSAA
jgi:protoporphyrinogen oxidase